MGRRGPGERGLKIRIASVGRDRSGLFAPGVAAFSARLRHYCRFSLVELPEGRNRAVEGERFVKLLGPRDRLVALDERGAMLTSVDLSKLLGEAQNRSHDLVFAVGGDEGLSDELKARAHQTLSLSRLTLPHRMARLVLVEQLYRAFTLLKGEPYHRD